MKLNRKKVHWIIRHKQKGVGTKEITRDVKVSRRRVQQIWKCFKETGKEPKRHYPKRQPGCYHG